MNRPLRSGASCAFLRAPPYAAGGIPAALKKSEGEKRLSLFSFIGDARKSCAGNFALRARCKSRTARIYVLLLGAYSGSRFFVNSQLHLIGDRITDKPSAFLEMIGLEPTTSCMPCKRSSQVSYTPVFIYYNKISGVLSRMRRTVNTAELDQCLTR